MTCGEFQELAAAYALGALEPAEAAAAEAHLAAATHDDACTQALARARAAAEAMAASLPPRRPPPRVWDAIATRLGTPARAPSRRPYLVAAGLALAAAAALAVVAVSQHGRLVQLRETLNRSGTQLFAQNVKHVQARKACQAELDAMKGDAARREAAIALLGLPDSIVVPMPGKDRHANAVVNFRLRAGVVVAHGLSPVDNKDYELWIIRGGKKLPAGVFHGEEDGEMLIPLDPELLEGGAEAIAITLEPPGGGPEPRGDVVLAGSVPKG